MSSNSNAMDLQHQLIYLLSRPTEPIFVPKGDNKALFDFDASEYAERFRSMAEDLDTRAGEAEVKVSVTRANVPDLSFPKQLGRKDNFSLFVPYHQEMAARLIEIFMNANTALECNYIAGIIRDEINTYMWIYAYSVAVLHRPDTRGLQLPPLNENLPDKFLAKGSVDWAREEANIHNGSERKFMEISRDTTATDLDPEHRVAYFREDVDINLHHWHWHLAYPSKAPLAVARKDRRGELFYYMHQQMQARYDLERLCNRLGRVKRLHLRVPLEEGYFPKLDSQVARRTYPSRHPGAILSDINRAAEQVAFDVDDLERWVDRIIEAIHLGRVTNEKGESVELTEDVGIDILGNMIESSTLSVNPSLYGDLHNLGHFLLAMTHDPDQRHLETFGVMGDPATSMRDPVFYRWHAFIDNIFQMHKRTLTPYPVDKLEYKGVKMTNLEVTTAGRQSNELVTFWQQKDVDMSRGFPFAPDGTVFVRITHLQHAPFTYKIQLVKDSSAQRTGTIRIFLAPKFDERGLPMLFRDQRLLFVEMDKFEVTLLRNNKSTTITRKSTASSVTVPFSTSFRELEAGSPKGRKPLVPIDYCGCGWPQHMLLPKGTAEGFPCQIFAMFSDIKDDKVEEISISEGSCKRAPSYCGLQGKKYPDRRSMGFPFDRVPRKGVTTLDNFLTDNMKVTEVCVSFVDIVEPPEAVSNKVQ